MAGGTGDVAFRMARRGAHVTVATSMPTCSRSERAREARSWRTCPGSRECRGAELRRRQLRRLHDRVRHPERHRHSRGLAGGYRVLKRGGRFYCMEFSSSDWPGFRPLRSLGIEGHPAHRQGGRQGRGQLPLSRREHPPLSAPARIQGDGDRSRPCAPRPSRCSAGL